MAQPNNQNSVDFYDILKSSYGNEQSINNIKNKGYKYDSMLSNNNVKVFHNPQQNKLLVGVAGTHNLSDALTDVNLAVGNLKNTDRYKEARDIYNRAKTKYNPNKTVVAGHSLGGAIAQYVANKNDKVYTLDKGATIGQKTRKNETAYRTSGDVVSLLNANSTRMKTLNNPNTLTGFLAVDALNAHNVNNIKDSKIFI